MERKEFCFWIIVLLFCQKSRKTIEKNKLFEKSWCGVLQMNKAQQTANRAKEVDRVMHKQVARSSKKQYVGYQARLVCFLHEFHRKDGCVNLEFFKRPGLLVGGKAQLEAVKKCLMADFDKNDLSCAPVHLALLSAKTVGECVIWSNEQQQDKVSGKIGIEAVRGFLAAVKDLFRTYNVVVSEDYQRDIDKISRGYAKDTASSRQKNHKGKEALPFEIFCEIGQKTLEVNAADYVFARTFMILQWNLMCRADNMEHIELDHLGWNGDCLEVFFRKQKNDQDGSRSEVPRHVYANPVKPEICAILALGIFFLCVARKESAGKLFQGSSQAARFGTAFHKILEKMSNVLKQYGYEPSDFGSHSNRKGPATFVTSGTPDGPAQVPVNLRGGWTMTSVENSYFRFERAGDQFVGRTVAGLPTHSAQFATLPPLFREETDEDKAFVEGVVRLCFPFLSSAPDKLFPILKFALASVVWHSEWLLDNLPHDHTLFQSALFAGDDLARLQSLVVCELPSVDGSLQATGVPRGVMTHLEIQRLREEQKQFRAELVDFRVSFEDTLNRGLNNFALSQGHLTLDAIKGLFSTQLEAFDARLADALRGAQNETSVHAGSENRSDEAGIDKPSLHCWGGKFHPVPETFSFTTKMPLRQAFVQWTVGNATLGYPPFRLLQPDDMPNSALRRSFSNLKQVMKRLEKEAKSKQLWPKGDDGQDKSRLAAHEALALFEEVEGSLAISGSTPTGRERRLSEISWSTVYIERWRKSNVKSAKEKKRGRGNLRRRDGDEGDASEPSEGHVQEEMQEDDAQGRNDVEEQCDVEADEQAHSEEVLAHVRLPNFDIQKALEDMTHYCYREFGLVKGEDVPGDGSCFFHVVSRQLRQFGVLQGSARIRSACVDWVMAKYGSVGADPAVLLSLGYEGWSDWEHKMRQTFHYADELCFEAVPNIFNVRMLLVVATQTVSHRYLEPAERAAACTIVVGLVGDHHCYEYVSKKGQHRRQQQSVPPPVQKRRK